MIVTWFRNAKFPDKIMFIINPAYNRIEYEPTNQNDIKERAHNNNIIQINKVPVAILYMLRVFNGDHVCNIPE